MALRIGLTGGIASGKSLAAAEFARLGVPVVDADEIAREVTAPGAPVLADLAALLPDEPVVTGGVLDRRRLRERMFRDPALRRRVEQILHPVIIERIESRSAAADVPYVLIVIPLLGETGAGNLVDRVAVVDCPEHMQVARLMRRDGETEAGARRMLAAQMPRSERLKLADDVLDNSGAPEALAAQVEVLHEEYQRLSDS